MLEGVVSLPGGLFSDDNHCRQRAELRALSGFDEEWLSAYTEAPSAVIVSGLLANCVVRLEDTSGSLDLARRLLVGDRDYLMLQLRRLSIGDRIDAVLTCPTCNERLDVDFLASQVPVDARAQTSGMHSVLLEGGREVQFRLPTGGDQEAVVGLDMDAAVEELFARCVIEDGGGGLTADDREVVNRAMDLRAPQVSLELELECPECATSFIVDFDTTRFFLDELLARRGHLVREIHQLAFHYHWSEADILRLTRPRRRMYLSLIADELRAD